MALERVKRVRTWVVVVMVVVRELFSLLTSVICVLIRGHSVTRVAYHMAQHLVYCAVLTTGDA